MRDRTASRFGTCITPLVLGAIQFAFTTVAPWAFVQNTEPHAQPRQTVHVPSRQPAATHPPHILPPPPVVKDIVKSATKVPALSAEDAFEDTLPALTETFVVAE
jgi:hypothetical protein